MVGKKAAVAVSQLAVKEWITVLGLIFGGCCSNVFTLEKIVTHNPESGNVVTFFQFLFIGIEGYIHFFDHTRPPFFLKKNQVPLSRWIASTIMFFVISMLNNTVFKFKISIPIHIIFRSSGTAIVMIIGYFVAKKQYNTLQVISALLLSIGAIITTLYKDKEIFEQSHNQIMSIQQKSWLSMEQYDPVFLTGIGMLVVAAVLMALMGLHNEETYRMYGKHWQENLLYSHLIGLPMFLVTSGSIWSEWKSMWSSRVCFDVMGIKVPKQIAYLGLNVLTQFFCVRGANMLAGNTSALTVSVVLLLRKFTSLLLSMYLFNNRLSVTGSVGAGVVFLGALLYSYGSTGTGKTFKAEQEMPAKEKIPAADDVGVTVEAKGH